METQPRPRRADFALRSKELEQKTVPRADHDSFSDDGQLIVHPFSVLSSATSPTYGADWQLAAFLFQRQEMARMLQQQQQQKQQEQERQELERQRTLSLLDFTCDENLKSILGFLDGVSLCGARRVCRHFYELTDNDAYWYNLCIAEWAISPDQLREKPTSYQALYKFACQSLQKMIREFFQEQCLASMQSSFRIPRDAALTIARRSFGGGAY